MSLARSAGLGAALAVPPFEQQIGEGDQSPLPLTRSAKARPPPADHDPRQMLSAPRAATPIVPAMPEEPRSRILPLFVHDAQRGRTHPAHGSIERAGLPLVERSRGEVGPETRSPEDLVGHPVADAGKAALVEQHGFDGGASAPHEKRAQQLRRELQR